MSEPDELLSKADALLARRRTSVVVPQPPADYPVLTEVVDVPAPTESQGRPAGTLDAAQDLLQPPLHGLTSLPFSADVRALEERVRLRALEKVELRLQEFLEEFLRLHMGDLARRLATNIRSETRDDIMSLVRETVRDAVNQELQTKGEDRPDDGR